MTASDRHIHARVMNSITLSHTTDNAPSSGVYLQPKRKTSSSEAADSDELVCAMAPYSVLWSPLEISMSSSTKAVDEAMVFDDRGRQLECSDCETGSDLQAIGAQQTANGCLPASGTPHSSVAVPVTMAGVCARPTRQGVVLIIEMLFEIVSYFYLSSFHSRVRMAVTFTDVGPSKPTTRRESVAKLQSHKAWLSHKESLKVVLHEYVVALCRLSCVRSCHFVGRHSPTLIVFPARQCPFVCSRAGLFNATQNGAW